MKRDEVINKTVRHLQMRGYYPKKNVYMTYPGVPGGVHVNILVEEEEKDFASGKAEKIIHTIGFECRGDTKKTSAREMKIGISNAHFNMSYVDEYYVVIPESWENLMKSRIFKDFLQRTGVGIWLCGEEIIELIEAKRVLWVMEEEGKRGGIRETPRKYYEPMKKPKKQPDYRKVPWDNML